jgi:hypothetical protein
MVANISAAETVVLVQAAFCSLSQHPIILAWQSGRTVEGARIDIYRKIDNGEKLAWSGRTDQRGVARPGELEPGSYRLLAYSGNLSAEMRLGVSNNGEGGATCEVMFVPPISAEQQQKDRLAVLVRDAPRIELREFRGVVEDATEAVIPRLKIQVLRKEALDKGNVAEIQSDERGQFAASLDRGNYVAIFTHPGFRTRAIAFEVGNEGWRGVRIALSVGGSLASPNAAPLEWNPTQ